MTPLVDLLEQYEAYVARGMQACQAGALAEGKQHLTLAVGRLIDIAGKTQDPRLQEARLEQVDELLELIESLEARSAWPGDASGCMGHEEDGADTPERGPLPMAAKPELTLNDVAGLEDVKQLVGEKLIDPFLYPDMAEAFGLKAGGGILLYGPPGTGKTMIARAIAGEVDAALFHVLPGDIMSKWAGEPEKNIKALFAEARKHPRAVIFMDEIDALAASRQQSENYMRRLINQLLAEMQGFETGEASVLVIGATNHPELIDTAMLRPGRFDELVYVPLPGPEARKALWEMGLAKRTREGDFNYGRLAALSEGYNGSEIAYVCDKAARLAFKRYTSGINNAGVTEGDILEVLDALSPRTTQADIERLMAFSRKYDRNLHESPAIHTDTLNVPGEEEEPAACS